MTRNHLTPLLAVLAVGDVRIAGEDPVAGRRPSERSYPEMASGRRYPKWAAASSIAIAMRFAASRWP
ncbi:hypothetical protein [Micromonospora ureilytica]|uniref:Uncharacterized protein n=1 Tax=Micromonospora ureilytica TaxID=709868 RepID=A0ABS0JBT1_9ACTN|nr:hypothetical protein [Micromonospora ureilytica]MBG6064518.1 hypothetical protein [Micromonospora ureilytica]